jgi:hypothetical protein
MSRVDPSDMELIVLLFTVFFVNVSAGFEMCRITGWITRILFAFAGIWQDPQSLLSSEYWG